MNTAKKIYGIALVLALACGLPMTLTLKAQDIYVANSGNTTSHNTIGEYGLDGATVNTSLISGLTYPFGIAISGDDLFVANYDNGTVGEYGLEGSMVNASLITGLYEPIGIAISPAPEPSTIALVGLGAVALWLRRCKKGERFE